MKYLRKLQKLNRSILCCLFLLSASVNIHAETSPDPDAGEQEGKAFNFEEKQKEVSSSKMEDAAKPAAEDSYRLELVKEESSLGGKIWEEKREDLLSKKYNQTAIIPIEGPIEPSSYAFLKRSVAEALESKVDRIIFKINTFGGRLDSAYKIVDLLLSIEVETVAYVDKKAISAGTLIALACRKLVMEEGSTLGDVAPITTGGEGGVTMLGEKFQSPLRAKFRSLAEQNGYPVKIVEAFVSADREIFELEFTDGSKLVVNGIEYSGMTKREKQRILKKRTLVAAGELLTLSHRESLNLGFSIASLKNHEQLLSKGEQVSDFQPTPSETIVALISRYAGLFIILALLGLYLEAQSPGFGFFGIGAVAVITVLFIGLYAVELATYSELALLILGIGLLAVEVFVLPGFGLAGVSGVLCILTSFVLMLQDFTIPKNPIQIDLFQDSFLTVIYAFIASTILFFGLFFVLRKTQRRNPLVLHASAESVDVSEYSSGSDDEEGHDLSENARPNKASGERGAIATTETSLNPAGKILYAGKVYDAHAESEFIPEGQLVKIIGSRYGAKLVTRVSAEKQGKETS